MKSYGQHCALAQALDRVGDRWTMLVVRELLLAPRRFSDLAAALPGIASNLLSERLKHLEAEGLVTRRELPSPAGAQVYALTEVGEELREVVHALIRFGGRYMVARRQEDVFRPAWLSLAFEAMAPPPQDMAMTVAVRTPEGQTTFRVERGSVVSAEGSSPEVLVEGEVSTFLAGTAGLLPRAAIDARMRFTGRREHVVPLRRWLFLGPRGAPRGASVYASTK